MSSSAKAAAKPASGQKMWWGTACPLRCNKKCRNLGKFYSYEDAVGRVLYHLKQSSNHEFDDDAAMDCLAELHDDALWEEPEWKDANASDQMVDIDEQSRHEAREFLRKKRKQPEPVQHQPIQLRSVRQRLDEDRQNRLDDRLDDDRQSRLHRIENPSESSQGLMGSSDALRDELGDELLVKMQEKIVDQKNKMFTFARVLGKCEAVIRTAARVARDAASTFEDQFAIKYMFTSYTPTQHSLCLHV